MIKTIVTPTARFSAAAYPVETEPCIWEKRRRISGESRESIRVTVAADVTEVLAAFRDGMIWSIEEKEDENAVPASYDKSAFCICGDVVDHRDGKVTVYLAQKTTEEQKTEKLEAENAALLFENLTGGTY